MAGTAQALVTVEAVELVPIDPAAVTQDPALATCRSYDLLATSDGDLISINLTVTADGGGGIYNHAMEGSPGDAGPPDPAWVTMFAGLAYDTYVNMPGTTLLLLGTLHDPVPASIQYGDLTSVGDPEHGPQTDFQIARITLTDPGTGLANVLITENLEGVDVPYDLDVVLPEPATLSLLALGGLAVLRRRR